MKKLLSAMLALAMVLVCLSFVACVSEKDDVAGTYVMTDISGTVTYNGQTVALTDSLYEYFRIILNEDGTAKIESKGVENTAKVEVNGTWEYEEGLLSIKSETNGLTVIEEMQWEDGVISYDAKQSGNGMTISFTIILEKE